MPGRKPRTSRPLIFIAVILCLIFGGTFTQSSANPSPINSDRMPEMFVAGNTETSAFTSDSTVADTDKLTDDSREKEPAVTNTPAPTSTETPAKKDSPSKASPEAAKGTWTSSGSHWMFLIDGTPYTGWLTDTDGNRYYFNADGIMQTGWLDDGDKRYYLNLDGIMQTGDITVDQKTYHLKKDGSLKGYTPAEAKPTQKPEKVSSEKKKSKKKKSIALTFDDGPSSFTNRLLDCLEANNAKATFFMVGTEIASFPDEVKRIAKLGYELGNHTYNHVDLTTLSAEEITSQIGRVDQALMELTGQGASVVRPPYGSINDASAASVGTPMILWSIDTLDWETLDVQNTVDTVMEQVEDGAVILMHDIYSTTVDAVEILIPRLIEEGYELVTVHELAAAHGIDLKPGIAYGELK